MDSRNMIAGLYDLEETIGEGHYAVVKLARHVFTGEKVAVKVIDKQKLDQSTQTQMLQEVKLMKLVQHPNVVRLYEVIDTHTKLYLVLELGDGGDMYDYIMKHDGGLDEEKARKYFRQIVTAIQYCHKLHVVHRDLKPENVVFFEKLGMVKLTDFGFSNKFDPGQRLMTSCGSLAYSAPEILLGDAYDAPAVDIWSLGVILYMLVCGSAPFQEANDSETLTMIMDCNYSVPSHISAQCRGLISSMLRRDPSKRATLEQIAADPWLTADTSVPLWDMLPLVTREHLSEEDHAHILQKMVAGSIASRETIIESLDRNEYNHVTATYFLLAERKLRAQRQEAARRARSLKRQGSGSSLHRSDPSKRQPPSLTPGASSGSNSTPAALKPTVPSATVESLLSPQDPKKCGGGSGGSASGKNLIASRHGYRVRQCSIVEEDEEEEEEDDDDDNEEKSAALSSKMPVKGLSRHSSTSSLADNNNCSSRTSPSLHLDLTLAFAAQRLAEDSAAATLPTLPTPAPFPPSSQIGTGLSRQNSLRRSGESTTSGSSPASERKSTPGSPGSPTATSTSSPARYKIAGSSHHGGRKLVSTRSNPQLGPLIPLLNQIHEESEEGANSPAADATVDTARSSSSNPGMNLTLGGPAGAAVLRRLEQRRRLHKSRTASCSSSDASDDDSESRKKRGGRGGLPVWRDSNDSDNTDQGGEGGSGSGGLCRDLGGRGGGGGSGWGSTGGDGSSNSSGGGGSSDLSGGQPTTRHYRLQRNAARVRQSSSLNRISELHEVDFGEEEGGACENAGGQSEQLHASQRNRGLLEKTPVREFTPQLSSESEGEPPPLQVGEDGGEVRHNGCLVGSGVGGGSSSSSMSSSRRPPLDNCDLLGRYLDSLSSTARPIRSRDDSLNSSDSENAGGEEPTEHGTSRRRSKVNLRQLEERLNMIQEECNRDTDESDDERSATIDERSEKNEDTDTIDNNNEEQILSDSELDNNNSQELLGNSQELLSHNSNHNSQEQLVLSNNNTDRDSNRNFESVFSRIEHLLNGDKKNCGRSRSEGWAYSDCEESIGTELWSGRDRRVQPPARGRPRSAPPRTDKTLHRAHSCGSLMSRQKTTVATFWDILSDKPMVQAGPPPTELTLTISSVSSPLSLIHLQAGSSRCCNLC